MKADVAIEAIAGWRLAAGRAVGTGSLIVADLLPLVKNHKLIGVLQAMVAEGAVRVDDEAAVAHAHADAMVEALLLEDALLQAAEALDGAGIEHRVLKGAALAHTAHPDPSQRSFGDNDLLVIGDQMQAAIDVLEATGGRRLQPRVSPLFDRRFTKSVTMGWLAATELDLHRSLVPGPFGLRIAPAELFADPTEFELAGRTLRTLAPEMNLLHGALHVALGDVEWRLGNVRDVALLLEADIDVSRVISTAAEWRCELPLAIGVGAAGGIGAARTPLVEWADSFAPSKSDRRLLTTYRRHDKRFRAQAWASLRVLGWRDRASYAWAITHRR